MKLEPIIISLLDTDLYKFNMDQVIFHKHTDLCGSIISNAATRTSFSLPKWSRRSRSRWITFAA